MGWLGDDDSPLSGSAAEADASVSLTKRMFELIGTALANTEAFAITPELVCELHRIGAEGLVSVPGVYRDDRVAIEFARHKPPTHDDVPALVEDMCADINAGARAAHAALSSASPEASELAISAAAFALWRLNWIHPFEDGNGRTSRALCYLVLSWASAAELNGSVTLPERIQWERAKYFKCLEAADEAWKNPKARKNALTQLSGFLGRLVRNQLAEKI